MSLGKIVSCRGPTTDCSKGGQEPDPESDLFLITVTLTKRRVQSPRHNRFKEEVTIESNEKKIERVPFEDQQSISVSYTKAGLVMTTKTVTKTLQKRPKKVEAGQVPSQLPHVRHYKSNADVLKT